MPEMVNAAHEAHSIWIELRNANGETLQIFGSVAEWNAQRIVCEYGKYRAYACANIAAGEYFTDPNNPQQPPPPLPPPDRDEIDMLLDRLEAALDHKEVITNGHAT